MSIRSISQVIITAAVLNGEDSIYDCDWCHVEALGSMTQPPEGWVIDSSRHLHFCSAACSDEFMEPFENVTIGGM